MVLGFTAGHFVFETYLNYRQYKFLLNDKPSKDLQDLSDEETFRKTQQYQIAKQKFSIFSDVYQFVQNVSIIKFNVLSKIYYATGHFLTTYAPKFTVTRWIFGPLGLGPTPQSVLTSLTLVLLNSLIDLPLSYYSTFVLEEKFGFNKQTKKVFFTDLIKVQALNFVIGTPVMLGFIKIIEYFGDSFFVYLWTFFFALQIFLMTIAPVVIMPLFNKFTPLEDGSLKTKIEDLAKSLHFPLSKLFVIDGSKRSSHSNAFFTGMPWSKKIVLYDTLIEQSSEDEIVAVISHEIGHWAKSHLLKRLIAMQTHVSLIFFLFSAFFRNVSFYQSFGFTTFGSDPVLNGGKPQLPILMGFMLFMDILKPMEFIATFLTNLLSRKHEYEADEFATDLGKGKDLCNGLTTLFKENLSSANSDPLYSAYHFSHPSLPERLRAIKLRMAEIEGKKDK